jgi:hypothetical protein
VWLKSGASKNGPRLRPNDLNVLRARNKRGAVATLLNVSLWADRPFSTGARLIGLAAPDVRDLQRAVPSNSWRAQGKPDAGCTRGLVCSVESTRVRNHRLNRSDPAFPAQWFYGLSRALPGVPGFLATIDGGSSSANLIPASGDQDHTISPSAPAALVLHSLCVHRIPPPTFVTIGRSAPPERAGCAEISIYFGKMEVKFFNNESGSSDPIEALRIISLLTRAILSLALSDMSWRADWRAAPAASGRSDLD